MRCFFLRRGHIAGVEMMPGLTDVQAVEKCRTLFDAQKEAAGYEGFEVWDQARMVIQHPPVTDQPPAPEKGKIDFPPSSAASEKAVDA